MNRVHSFKKVMFCNAGPQVVELVRIPAQGNSLEEAASKAVDVKLTLPCNGVDLETFRQVYAALNNKCGSVYCDTDSMENAPDAFWSVECVLPKFE